MPNKRQGPGWGEGSIERHRAHWREADGHRYSKGCFSDEESARAHLVTIGNNTRRGNYPAPSTFTVRELVAAYFARGERDSTYGGATVAAHHQRARKHLMPALGSLRVETLITQRIQVWMDTLTAKGLAAQTIQDVMQVPSGALREAVRLQPPRTQCDTECALTEHRNAGD